MANGFALDTIIREFKGGGGTVGGISIKKLEFDQFQQKIEHLQKKTHKKHKKKTFNRIHQSLKKKEKTKGKSL
jgi:hypothetical protein